MQPKKHIHLQNMIYDSSARINPGVEELRDVFKYRDLILLLAQRDIMTRYKRSVLGVAWTMLNPLGMMLVLTVVFSQLFKQVQGYPAYILSGLIIWQFFSQTTTAAMINLVWGGGLLHRIYLPRTSFALAAIMTGLINLGISLIPLIAVILVIGMPIKLTFLLVPVPILFLAMFSLGLGLLLSTIAVYFPDVAEMYQILLTAWMYLTPIFYPESALPAKFGWYMTRLNPVYHLVQMFRICVYEERFPHFYEIWPGALIATVTLLIGWFAFARKSNEFGYRI
jgi:homopolymeric O-antigen transport system permease protein